MPNTSNAVAGDKAQSKTGPDKVSDKVAEKRRALGRGLDSLLPGPRVVVPVTLPPPAGAPSSVLAGSAPADKPSAPAAPAISSSIPVPSEVFCLLLINAAASPAAKVVNLPAAAQNADGEQVSHLEVARIDENPYQTRRNFDEKSLSELAQSIQAQGVLQPIVVRPAEQGRFTLILGERRLRAARLAGMLEIPAIVKRVSNQQAAEMTVVENLQRQDLNCVEQAMAFADLSKLFHLTQEQIGARVRTSRETVANYLRLLTLAEGILDALQKGTLTFSHARVLLMVQDPQRRWTIAKKAIDERMSVAKLDALVQGTLLSREPGETKEGGARWLDPNVKAAQRTLETVLGLRVKIRDHNGRGRIQIEYSTLEDFDRVVGMLQGK